jgi:hypothetical protein
MEACTMRSRCWIARLADNLNDIPLLFPPLKHIAFDVADICCYVYVLVQLWKHL